MRRIIFINRYYKPDHSATAQLLTEIAEILAAKKHHVLVITSQQHYEDAKMGLPKREILNGVSVIRVWTTAFGRSHLLGRALDYVSFYIACFFCLLFLAGKHDTLVAKTDPPMISVIAALVAKIKGAKLINWIQDLFPEVADALSNKAINRTAYKVIKYFRNWSLTVADKNIVIGNIMAGKIASEGVLTTKIQLIPNWVVGEDIRAIPEHENTLISEWNLQRKFIVGYSGNLGRAHHYTTLFKVAEKMQGHADIHFLFIGSGKGMDAVKELANQHQLNNMSFKPYQPIEMLSHSLSVPNVHIITLQKELEGLIVPSKFYGVLAVNKPILYVGVPDGELGSIITASQCGGVFDENSVDSICDWLIQLSNDKKAQADLCEATKHIHLAQFNKTLSLNLLEEALCA